MDNKKIDITKNMGSAPLRPLLASLAIPAIIAMLVNGLYYVVDAAFVGWGVGGMALAGLATIFPVQMFMISWGTMLGVGVAALISKRLGEGRTEEARNAAGTSYVLALISGLAATFLSLFFREPFLHALGTTDETLPMARDFLIGLEPGFAVMFLSMVGFNVVRAQGRAKEAGIGMIIGTIANLILDPVFIFVLGTGVKGAAWATVLSRVISTTYFIIILCGRKNVLGRGLGRINVRDAGRLLALGAGTFFGQIGPSILAIVVNRSLQRYGTSFDLASYGMVSRIHVFITMPFLGLAQGLQPIAGFNAGAGKSDRVGRVTRLTLWCSVGLGIVMAIPCLFFPEALAKGFAENQNIRNAGAEALRLSLLMLPLIGVQIIGFSFLQALGHPVKTLILSLSRQVLFLIPLVVVLPVYWGIKGLWYAFPVADFLSVVLSYAWIRRELKNIGAVSNVKEFTAA